MIMKTTSPTLRGRSPEWWARAGVIVQLVILIRTVGEFYRMRHYDGQAQALVRYEPYLGGLLIDAVLCLVTVALLFWRKPRAAALTAAATVIALLIYKVVAIG
jgi:hypothetical protein